jgi:hypothetical protein
VLGYASFFQEEKFKPSTPNFCLKSKKRLDQIAGVEIIQQGRKYRFEQRGFNEKLLHGDPSS